MGVNEGGWGEWERVNGRVNRGEWGRIGENRRVNVGERESGWG